MRTEVYHRQCMRFLDAIIFFVCLHSGGYDIWPPSDECGLVCRRFLRSSLLAFQGESQGRTKPEAHPTTPFSHILA